MQPSKQISTLSDMQRQLEMIDLASLNLPNSIKNQSSDEEEENAMMNSIRSKYDLKPSINIPLYQPEHFQMKTYLFDIDAEIAYKRRQRSLKRIEKMHEEVVSNKMHGSGSFQMFGGMKTSKTSLTTASLNTMTMFSSFRSRHTKLNTRVPVQRSWEFGDLLQDSGLTKLETLFKEFGMFGCGMCSGFGHAKSKCPSLQHLQAIKTGCSFNATRINHSVQWVNSRLGIYCDRWLLGDFLGASTWKQILLVRNGETQASNIIFQQAESLGQDLMRIYNMQCIVCQGFGHVIKQTASKKQRKDKNGNLTTIPGSYERNQNGTIYLIYDNYCPTKAKMEEILLGSKEAYSKFRQLLQQHKSEQKRKGQTRVYDGKDFGDTKDVLAYMDEFINQPSEEWKKSGDLTGLEIERNKVLKTQVDAVEKTMIEQMKREGIPVILGDVQVQQAAQQAVQAANVGPGGQPVAPNGGPPPGGQPAQVIVANVDEYTQKRLTLHKFLLGCYARSPQLAAVATHVAGIEDQNNDEEFKDQQEDLINLQKQLNDANEEDDAEDKKKEIRQKIALNVKKSFSVLQEVSGDPVSEKSHIEGDTIPYITCRHKINEARTKYIIQHFVDAYEFVGFTFKVPVDQKQTTNIMNLYKYFGPLYFPAFFKDDANAKAAYNFVTAFQKVPPAKSFSFAKVAKVATTNHDLPDGCLKFAIASG